MYSQLAHLISYNLRLYLSSSMYKYKKGEMRPFHRPFFFFLKTSDEKYIYIQLHWAAAVMDRLLFHIALRGSSYCSSSFSFSLPHHIPWWDARNDPWMTRPACVFLCWMPQPTALLSPAFPLPVYLYIKGGRCMWKQPIIAMDHGPSLSLSLSLLDACPKLI